MATGIKSGRVTDTTASRVILAVMVILFLGFALRLWQLQMIEGDKYRKLAESNRIHTVKVPAPRGIIYDRNGIPLVQNVPAFDVSVTPSEFPMESTPLLAALLSMSSSELDRKIRGRSVNPNYPVKVKLDVTREEIAKVEARKLELPGVDIQMEASRKYLYGSLGAHVLGYLGRLRPDQADDERFKGVPPDSFVGQWGLEAVFDEYLRGVPGEEIYEVNALGQKIRQLGRKPPEKGNDLRLTLDMYAQKAAEDAFDEEDKAGAAVAIDPNTGGILAMVSRPSFDPNLFATGINPKEWKEFINDPRKPMFNRAIQSQYPPGSTFKVVVALAALANDRFSPDSRVHCSGGIPFGGRTFRCWKKGGHGSVDLRRAIVESCDVYFYQTGLKLGIDPIAAMAESFGMGAPPKVGLVKEASGIVPSSAWKMKRMKQPWYAGETLSCAIGQGYVSASPYQMAEVAAIIGNGGTRWKPSFVKGTTPEAAGKINFDPAAIGLVRDAMRGVVEEGGGTAHRAKSQITTVAGKTGTAQVVGNEALKFKKAGAQLGDHGWFIAFSPVEKPDIAISVFVEHGGHGGSVAAPIAKSMIEAFRNREVPEKKKSEEEKMGAGGD
ncbi:MAG: penicillin-binding protein 2 [Nitrospirae bacterium]|nr:penicillin-binding protein 2 [Nitrospirota bacterium]